MTSQSTTRSRLISEGMRQMLAHGYEGIGIGPILSSMKVPKGSFYHFFKSKDDYVVAIIEAYEEQYCDMREALFADTSRGPIARLYSYFESLERELTDRYPFVGCLYGVLAQTAAARQPAVRDKLLASYGAWEDSIRRLLVSAQEMGEIARDADMADMAASIVDAYEGALIRMKASDDISAFTRFRTKTLPRLIGRREP